MALNVMLMLLNLIFQALPRHYWLMVSVSVHRKDFRVTSLRFWYTSGSFPISLRPLWLEAAPTSVSMLHAGAEEVWALWIGSLLFFVTWWWYIMGTWILWLALGNILVVELLPSLRITLTMIETVPSCTWAIAF